MASGGIISDMKAFYNDLIDKNGNFRTVPTGDIGKRKISEDRLMLLQTLYSLVKETDIVCDATRMYISDKYITVKGVAEELSELKGKEVNVNTTNARIYNDKLKLERLLGKSFMADVVLSGNMEKLAEHSNNIAKAVKKYKYSKGGDLRENIALKISDEGLCSELSDDKFDQFIMTIMPYLKTHMQKVSESIDSDSIGYFNYLMYSPTLNDVDKERLDRLKEILDPSKYDEETIEIE